MRRAALDELRFSGAPKEMMRPLRTALGPAGRFMVWIFFATNTMIEPRVACVASEHRKERCEGDTHPFM
jgi:hypothetical protein